MKDLEQWVCWRSEVRGRDGKKTKVPYSPRSGLRARSDDPDTWATLAEAEAAAHKDDYHGTGFVFTARDPFCGVDLDACVGPGTGDWHELLASGCPPWMLEDAKTRRRVKGRTNR